MKENDLVMFTDEGTYAKWFYGKLAIVQNVSYANDGKLHCRVRWLQPVLYFDRTTSTSDFAADKFTVQLVK
tara:strand:+ start:487 stop:699 length:213 start_codon:yes stop_codon:yes gene_type:complete